MILIPIALAAAGPGYPSSKDGVDRSFNDIWANASSEFIEEGVQKREARSVFAWSLLQRYLGLCRRELATPFVTHWRASAKTPYNLSHRTLLFMLEQGDAKYQQGLKEQLPADLKGGKCSVVVASLLDEIER